MLPDGYDYRSDWYSTAETVEKATSQAECAVESCRLAA